MGEFGVVGEEEKESETHTYNGSLAPGVKVVKQVMIMKGKDDSENRTEREEREAIFACFGNRAAPRATDRLKSNVQRANEARRWSATGKGAQIFVMVHMIKFK